MTGLEQAGTLLRSDWQAEDFDLAPQAMPKPNSEKSSVQSEGLPTKGTLKIFAIIIGAAGLLFGATAEPSNTNAAPSPPRPALVQRVYQTDTNSFFANTRTLVRAKGEQSDLAVLMSYFEQKGVDVSSPFCLYYKPRTGSLLIRTTEEDQKRIKMLLAEIQFRK